MPCCAWPPSEYLQQPIPSPALAPASNCAPRSSLRSLAGELAQPAASTGWCALGHWPFGEPGAAARSRAESCEASGGAGSTSLGQPAGPVAPLAGPPLESAASAETLLADAPSPQLENRASRNGARPESPGTAQLRVEEAQPAPGDPRASTAGGNSKGKRLAEGWGGSRDGVLSQAGGPRAALARNRAAGVLTQPLIEGG